MSSTLGISGWIENFVSSSLHMTFWVFRRLWIGHNRFDCYIFIRLFHILNSGLGLKVLIFSEKLSRMEKRKKTSKLTFESDWKCRVVSCLCRFSWVYSETSQKYFRQNSQCSFHQNWLHRTRNEGGKILCCVNEERPQNDWNLFVCFRMNENLVVSLKIP